MSMAVTRVHSKTIAQLKVARVGLHDGNSTPGKLLAMTRASLSVLTVLLTVAGASAQSVPEDSPLPMSAERSADSYAIYSSLLPLGETAGWKASFYAVRDSTVASLPPNAPCLVPPAKSALDRARTGSMNPHTAVTPPEEQRTDYEDILIDFDSHCHDRYVLEAGNWTTKLPVRLLSDQQQAQFVTSRFKAAANDTFAGAASLYGFSAVYFNAHHTTALVYATHVCGGLCGEGFWIALEKKSGTWKPLRWNAASWIS